MPRAGAEPDFDYVLGNCLPKAIGRELVGLSHRCDVAANHILAGTRAIFVGSWGDSRFSIYPFREHDGTPSVELAGSATSPLREPTRPAPGVMPTGRRGHVYAVLSVAPFRGLRGGKELHRPPVDTGGKQSFAPSGLGGFCAEEARRQHRV